MDKKNYIIIAIVFIAVVIVLLLVLKNTDKSNFVETTGVGTEVNTETTNNTEAISAEQATSLALTEVMPLATESVIQANGNTFTPKTIKVKSGEKVFITLLAEDDATHTLGFIDDSLSFIVKDFAKASGNQSITFPAPAIGTYSYYVDDKNNTGQLIVE